MSPHSLRVYYQHTFFHRPLRRDNPSIFSDTTTVTLSTVDDDESNILDAVKRAKAFRLCLRRIWAVSASLPNRARSLPNLIPAAGDFSVPSHSQQHHEHEQCTFDFCEHSRLDFTSVAQRHECRPKDCGNYVFPLEQLIGRVNEGGSTAWKLVSGSKNDVPSLLDPMQSYMAISHVWADGTGAGIWGPGTVNKCLYEFFCTIARDFQCEGCWWDAVSIPQEDKPRSKALAVMHNNYADARITLVHDLYLREWEWSDAARACFAIVMSPWYSRGWTALELAKSHKVKILFKARNGHHIIKDLDIDILGQVSQLSPYYPAANAIRKLRSAKIQSLGDLLSILAPRDTSKPRDVPIISGLLAGVDVSGGLSQQEIYQRILRKMGRVAQGHLFHSSATMAASGFSWCPTNILDIPMIAMEHASALLNLQENGDLEGTWNVCSVDSVPANEFSWHSIHDLTHIALKVALNDENRDKHILLVETPCSEHRALLVRPMEFDEDASNVIHCRFVGPVYFQARSEPGTFDDSLLATVKICNNEKMRDINSGTCAWDYVKERIGQHDETSSETNSTKLTGRDPNNEAETLEPLFAEENEAGTQKFKALLFFGVHEVDRDVQKSIFESESSRLLHGYSSPRLPDHVDMFYLLGEDSNVRVFFCGQVGAIEKVKVWLGNATSSDKPESGSMMLLHADQGGRITIVDPSHKGQEATTLLSQALLQLMAEKGEEEGVETLVALLLDNGAEHQRDGNGLWPIHLAVKSGRCDVVRSMLTSEKNPADVNMRTTDDKKRPLHLAAECNHADIVELLVGHRNIDSNSLNSRDKEGRTALILAAMKGGDKITRILVENGADTALPDFTHLSQTALHYAAAEGHSRCVSALLKSPDVDDETEPGGGTNSSSSSSNGGGDGGSDALVDSDEVDEVDDSSQTRENSADKTDIDFPNRESMTALHLASRKGCPIVVKILLKHGASHSTVDSEGRTALALAAMHGKLDTVRELLKLRSGVLGREDQKRFDVALLSAVAGLESKTDQAVGNRIVSKLLNAGAISGYSNPADGMTALHWAVKVGNRAIADMLVDRMAQGDERLDHREKKNGQSALIMTVANNHDWVEFATKLIDKGANAKITDLRGRTVLHWAAATQNLQVVENILREKDLRVALIDEKDNHKQTALHLAAQSETGEAVVTEALLGAPAIADWKDVHKRTALMLAAATGRVDAVAKLMPRSDLTAEDRSKKTALDLAAEKGHYDVVVKLLEPESSTLTDDIRIGALKLSAQQDGGRSSLAVSMAIFHKIDNAERRESIIPILLLSAATAADAPESEVSKLMEIVVDADARNSDDQTALMLAVINEKSFLFESLLDRGADPNLCDRQGRTPLMMAVERRAYRFADVLLHSPRADPNIQDRKGYTALHYAAESGEESLVELFVWGASGRVDMDAVDHRRRTALHIAIDKLSPRREGVWSSDHRGVYWLIWQYLLVGGTSPRAQDEADQTPLHKAVRRNRIDAVEAMVRFLSRRFSSAVFEVKDKKQRTPLLLAAAKGFWDMLVRLINMDRFDLNTQDAMGRTPLLLAAERSNVEVVSLLLSKNADPNLRDKNSRTPLLLAAEGGNGEIVSLLLGKSADPNLSDKKSRTPLLEAARNGHEKIVELLLEGRIAEASEEDGHAKKVRAKVDAQDDKGQTALMLAAKNGSPGAVDCLLKNKADPALMDNEGKKPWQRAMDKGHADIVDTLLSHQDEPNQDLTALNGALLQASRNGWHALVEVLLRREADVTLQSKKSHSTALHLAAMGGHAQVVRKLLDKGVDVATRDANGRTALMLATEHGFESIVQALVDQPETWIKRNINECMGAEALRCAAEKGFAGIVGELLKTDVAFETKDAVGRTALALAAINGSREIVQLLLEKENTTSAIKDHQGRTPLHYAAWGGHNDVVECLLKYDAAVNVLDNSKQTPLHFAAERASSEVVQLLLDRGANTHARSNDGQTALHRAAWGGSIEAVRLLRNGGADTSARDSRNNKAWQVAAEKGHESIVVMLLEAEASVETDVIGDRRALIFAAERGYAAVAEALLNRKADATAKDPDGRTPLHLAAMQGDQIMAELLVRNQGPEKTLDMRDNLQNTPLCMAVMKNQASVARLLIEKRADLNTRDERGRTVLHIAAEEGFADIVQILQRHGADPHARDKASNQKAWFLAAEAGHHQIARLLLDLEVDFNPRSQKIEELLLRMAGKGLVLIVKLLLEKGVNRDATDYLGQTALCVAAEKEKADVVKHLLDAGAEPNVQDSSLQTPLLWAVEKGNLRIMRLLLDRIAATKSPPPPPPSSSSSSSTSSLAAAAPEPEPAPTPTPEPESELEQEQDREPEPAPEPGNEPEPTSTSAPASPASNSSSKRSNDEFENMLNRTDSQGRTALLLAIERKKDETVRLLLNKGKEHGINLDIKNRMGKTALHLVAEMGKDRLATELAKAGVDQTIQDALGRTALLLTVQHGHKNVVYALLRHAPFTFANTVRLSDKHGRTPLHVATERGHQGIAEMLLECGSDVDEQDHLGRTALLLAADNGDRAMVDLFLKHKARQDLCDHADRTPLSLAVAHGDFFIVEALLGHENAAIAAAIAERKGQPLLQLAVKSGSKQVAWLVADHLTSLQGAEEEKRRHEETQTDTLQLKISGVVAVEYNPEKEMAELEVIPQGT